MRGEQGFEALAEGGVISTGLGEERGTGGAGQLIGGLEEGFFAGRFGFHIGLGSVLLPDQAQSGGKKYGEKFRAHWGRSHFLPHHHQSSTVRPRIRTAAITMTALLEDVSGELAPGGGEVRSAMGLG
jgi:hypothetical protein